MANVSLAKARRTAKGLKGSDVVAAGREHLGGTGAPEWDESIDNWKGMPPRNGKPTEDPEATEFRKNFDEPLDVGEPELRLIPIKLLDDSDNPRKVFKDIEDLAESIKTHGLLQPLPVRAGPNYETYFLIDGGRRLRACKLAGLKEVPCYVRQVTEDNRAVARLAANFDRSNLDPFEKAEAFQIACQPKAKGGAGLSQAELAKRLRISPGEVSNTIRLLEVPECWRPHVINGDTTVTGIRDGLLKYLRAGETVLIAAEEIASDPENDWAKKPWHADTISHFVRHAANQHLSRLPWGFQASKDDMKALEVVEIDGGKYAVNSELLKRLMDEQRKAQQLKQERAEKRAQKAKASPEGQQQAAENQAKIVNKKLWRYLTVWRQQRIIEKVKDPRLSDDHLWRLLLHFATQEGYGTRQKELSEVLVHQGGRIHGLEGIYQAKAKPREMAWAALQLWVGHGFEGWNVDLDPQEIDVLAQALGIDLKRDWRCEDSFLELLTSAQLAELAAEWKLTIPAGKRIETIDRISQAAGSKRLPSILTTVEPVALR